MQDHEFWQEFGDAAPPAPWTRAYPARLPDGRILMLPIRPLAGTRNAIASLILNQASFEVEAALADVLADRLSAHRPEVVVGLPTLGLSLARAVAERLGHLRYVPLGTSRKFWYDDALSVPISSITTVDAARRLYLDPRLATLVRDRRVALIDDVISTGRSMAAGVDLLGTLGIVPCILGAAMLQSSRWAAALPLPVEGVFASPLLERVAGGWSEAPDQTATVPDDTA